VVRVFRQSRSGWQALARFEQREGHRKPAARAVAKIEEVCRKVIQGPEEAQIYPR
jgi:hypothetical protein